MDKETKKWLVGISIAVAVLVILLLPMSGFDIGGFEIHKGIKIN